MASYPRSPSHLYDLRPIILAGIRKRSRAPHNYRVPESALNPQALRHLVSRLSAATALFLLASQYLLVLSWYRSFPLETRLAIVQWSSTLRCVCPPVLQSSAALMCLPHESDFIRKISHLRSMSANKNFSVAHKQIQHAAAVLCLYPSAGFDAVAFLVSCSPPICRLAAESTADSECMSSIFTADHAHPMRARKRRMTSTFCTLHTSQICASRSIRTAIRVANQMQHFRLWRLIPLSFLTCYPVIYFRINKPALP
jgi:hypothetical protein